MTSHIFLRNGIVSSLLALAVVGGSAHAGENDYDDIEQLMRSGQHREALARANAFLRNKPRDLQMRLIKGVIQMQSGKRSDAANTFIQITKDAPELPEPYNNLAIIYAGQGQLDKARAALETAIRTNPGYTQAYENLGDVHTRMASQAYSQAFRLDRDNATVAPKLAALRTVFDASTHNTAPLPVHAAPPAATPAAAPAPEASTPANAEAARAVERALQAWADAWTAQDAERYIAAYAADFTPHRGGSRQAWEEEQRARLRGASGSAARIDQVSVAVDGRTAIARFRLNSQTNQLLVTHQRTVDMVQGADGRWQIRREIQGRN